MGAVCSGLCALVSGLFCACSCVKCCCTGAMGTDGLSPTKAKLSYVAFLALGTLISFVIGKYGEDAVKKDLKAGDLELFRFTVTCEDVTGQKACSGNSAVLRASFASVLFFSFMLIGTIPVPTFSGNKNWRPLFGEGFHRGFWGFKILAYFALLIGSFFMKFFEDEIYTNVARFVSMLFLILQVLVLIDFAYVWNETWVERSGVGEDGAIGEAENKGWLYALLACMGGLYLTAFGGLIALLIFYKDCTETLSFSIVNLLFLLAFLLLTYFREELTGEQESFGPAAVVSAYTVYLTWSASTSNPDLSKECDPFGLQLGQNGAEIFFGLLIGTVTLVWTAYTVSANSKSLLTTGTSPGTTGEGKENFGGVYEVTDSDGQTKLARDVEKAQTPAGTSGDGGGGGATGEENEDPDDKLWIFHFIMVTASFYMAMVLTNWGVSQAEVIASGSQVGAISMYVKVAAEWAASLLFIWTLIAPAVLERDFS